jgi:hypothetical protein
VSHLYTAFGLIFFVRNLRRPFDSFLGLNILFSYARSRENLGKNLGEATGEWAKMTLSSGKRAGKIRKATNRARSHPPGGATAAFVLGGNKVRSQVTGKPSLLKGLNTMKG